MKKPNATEIAEAMLKEGKSPLAVKRAINKATREWEAAQAEEAESEAEGRGNVVPARFKAIYAKNGGNNGDEVAKALGALDLAQLTKLAEAKGLIQKGQYAHLNKGMQRMNIGNRIRGLVNRSPATAIAIEIAGIAFRGNKEAEA